MAKPEDNWGPWATGITPPERLARLRSLGTLVHAFYGGGTPLSLALFRAESQQPDDLEAALAAFNSLPSRDGRKVMCTYGNILKARTQAGERLAS